MKLILMIVSLFCIAGPNSLFAEAKGKLKNIDVSTPPNQEAIAGAEDQAALSKMSAEELNKAIFAAVDYGVFKSTLSIIDEEVDAVYNSEEAFKDAEKLTSKEY